jgi:membrane protease YdiL (CAAX protease family)
LSAPGPIGQGLRGNPRVKAAGCCIAILAVGIDFYAARSPSLTMVRSTTAIVAIGLLLLIARGDRQSLGLTPRPLQPWSYWCRVTLLIGGIMLVPIGVFSALVLMLDWPVAIPRMHPDSVPRVFCGMCVIAPLSEEAIYRVVLCAPLAAAFGNRITILVSGVVFGLLHVVYGNPGPDNLVAGFFLGWAYLKSGTIVVPLAWHSLGNVVALGAQVINWHVF